jgi:hypothetical protein
VSLARLASAHRRNRPVQAGTQRACRSCRVIGQSIGHFFLDRSRYWRNSATRRQTALTTAFHANASVSLVEQETCARDEERQPAGTSQETFLNTHPCCGCLPCDAKLAFRAGANLRAARDDRDTEALLAQTYSSPCDVTNAAWLRVAQTQERAPIPEPSVRWWSWIFRLRSARLRRASSSPRLGSPVGRPSRPCSR